MSDTCPTCQHERFRHDGNTPGCIECDCNDLWGDGEYFVYSDLSLLAELADEVNRLRALTTADDAMVERAAREIELHAPSYRPINWPDDHRELARVALEAALGVES